MDPRADISLERIANVLEWWQQTTQRAMVTPLTDANTLFMSGRWYRRDGDKFHTPAAHANNPTGSVRPPDQR